MVDEAGVILAGHGRYAAVRQLAPAEVPVVRIFYLTATEKRLFALAENRLAKLAGWSEFGAGEEGRETPHGCERVTNKTEYNCLLHAAASPTPAEARLQGHQDRKPVAS